MLIKIDCGLTLSDYNTHKESNKEPPCYLLILDKESRAELRIGSSKLSSKEHPFIITKINLWNKGTQYRT